MLEGFRNLVNQRLFRIYYFIEDSNDLKEENIKKVYVFYIRIKSCFVLKKCVFLKYDFIDLSRLMCDEC